MDGLFKDKLALSIKSLMSCMCCVYASKSYFCSVNIILEMNHNFGVNSAFDHTLYAVFANKILFNDAVSNKYDFKTSYELKDEALDN